MRFARYRLFDVIFKQFMSSFGGEPVKEGLECYSDPPPAIVTSPRVSEAGERREAERRAWSRLFVCGGGSFRVLLSCLSQIKVRRLL